METFETDEYFIQGNHFFEKDHRMHPAIQGVGLLKIQREKLELLLTDQVKTYNGTLTPRLIFYYPELIIEGKGQLLVRTDEYIEKENFLREDMKAGLRSLEQNLAIDDEGYLYQMISLNDENNIRLLITSGFNNGDVHSKGILDSGYSGYTPGSTLKEIIAQFESETNSVPNEWKNSEFPIELDNCKIHSKRVVGEEVPRYESGEWIRIKDDIDLSRIYGFYLHRDPGKSGKVISQKGQRLTVRWEDMYEGEDDFILCRFVEDSSDPFNELPEAKFISFRKKDSSDNIVRGYGWLDRETRNVAAVVPLASVNERNYLEETGDKLNYLLISQEDIDDDRYNNRYITYLTTLYSKDHLKNSSEYRVIHNTLEMAKIDKKNREYWTTSIYYLVESEVYSFAKVMEELTDTFLDNISLSTSYSYGIENEKALNDWLIGK